MKTQHTPAPWYLQDSNPKDLHIRAGKNGFVIAEITSDFISNQAEAQANAKLICAAPDLLEALIEALDQLEAWNPESEDTFTIKRAKQAIQKAIS